MLITIKVKKVKENLIRSQGAYHTTCTQTITKHAMKFY